MARLAPGMVGFRPNADVANPYTYDGNGNLSTDAHKSLAAQYNFLNLPRQITTATGVITNTYDATGRKWRSVTPEGTRDYAGGIEYLDGELESIAHPDGRLTKTPEGWRTEYHHKDHLGNLRVAFADLDGDGRISHNMAGLPQELLQDNHYYPFGMGQNGPWAAPAAPANRHLYNGKELVTDAGLGWHDYGARWYDAALGRWGQVDPLAEGYAAWSGYNYVMGNPVNSIDPDGRKVRIINRHWRTLEILSKIVASNPGGDMMRKLVTSDKTYRISLTFFTGSSGYDRYGKDGPPRTIYSVGESWTPTKRGGAMNSHYVMYHELTHASQHEAGRHRQSADILEEDAVYKTNVFRTIYGSKAMRHSYTGFDFRLSENPDDYNRGKERIHSMSFIGRLEYEDTKALFFKYEHSTGGDSPETRYGAAYINNDGEFDFKKFNNQEAYEVFLEIVKDYKKRGK